MQAFEIELKLAVHPEKIQVEELAPWPDGDGYVRYRMYNNTRNSVVLVDKTCWEKPFIMTEEDAWDYLEKLLYPEYSRVYSEDSVFTMEELQLIGEQIGRYMMSIK